MPLGERIANVEDLRTWKDSIPLHYEYTAGVAGEKFLRALARGKILGSKCGSCGTVYLPPKSYCVKCYLPIDDYVDLGTKGTVAAMAKSHVGLDGSRLKSPVTFAFVTFEGARGGLVHRLRGKGAKLGGRAAAKFVPPGKRKGALTDIEWFVPTVSR